VDTRAALHDEPNGSVVLEMESSGYPDVRRWVLNWGAEVEVLEPSELRDDIIKTMQQGLALYGIHPQ